MEESVNEVVLTGKLSQIGPVEYTPSGIPMIEMNLAAKQVFLDRSDYGYFDLIASGDVVRELAGFRVGNLVKLSGCLWQRKYRDRKGHQISETKVIVNNLIKSEDK